jgi:Cd2+/Zn2+-exporting ATPase
MQGNEEEYCAVCFDVEGLEKEEKPFWKERELHLLAASAILLLAGLVFEFFLKEKILALIIFLGVSVISGHRIIREGISALLNLRFSIETLMTIAATGAFLIGHGEEGAAVLFLFSIAEFLEEHAADRARNSIRALLKLAPETARVKRNGDEVEVHVHEVMVGDLMIVRPGEKIPLDGVVVKGAASVNQAPITGEAMPVAKDVGSGVYAGTINADGYLEVEATKGSGETVLSKIVKMVTEAQRKRSSTEKFIDRFSKYYTPTVIFLAAVVATVPPLLGQPFNEWFYRALVLLVVSCPCALAISTPVSMVSGITGAARNGVLIKGSSHLEEVSNVKAIAFDKTGTLTEGRPMVTDVIVTNDYPEKEILRIAASLETLSEHPIAKAVVEKAEEQGLELKSIRDFKAVAGKGVIGTMNGETYRVGGRRMFEELSVVFPEEEVEKLEEAGKTVILVANDRESIGMLAVMDRIREGAIETIAELKGMGLRVEMLTGDNDRTAKAIAGRIGVDEYHAELLPEDKVSMIEELTKRYGKVAMVGDGVNDAPALAKATVGIAMGAIGSDVALETADIALMQDDLSKLAYLMELSRKTLGVVKQNVVTSIAVKGTFALLALPGLVTLWLAVGVGDMGLSLAVILNAMRLSLIKPVGANEKICIPRQNAT